MLRLMRAGQSHRLDPALIALAAPKLPRASVKACLLQPRVLFGSPRTATDLALIHAFTGKVGPGIQMSGYPTNRELLRVSEFGYEGVVGGGLRVHAIELRSEFFHRRIFKADFTDLSTVQSYLCGN